MKEGYCTVLKCEDVSGVDYNANTKLDFLKNNARPYKSEMQRRLLH